MHVHTLTALFTRWNLSILIGKIQMENLHSSNMNLHQYTQQQLHISATNPPCCTCMLMMMIMITHSK